MRRASSSKPLALMALRLADSISPASSRITSSRTVKPSLTWVANGVPPYIAAMILLCRSSTLGLPTERSAMLGTCTSPCMAMGNWSVSAIGAALPSTPARRFMKPERKLRVPVSGWPSSMLSWVSKWLRVRSSVPAKGRKATWPLRYSG